MTTEEYKALSKIKRIAMFFIVIGPETAAILLSPFDDLEVEAISREMVAIDLIDYETQKALIEEFSPLLMNSVNSIQGGYQVALEVLEAAKGPYAARNVVGKMGPSTDSKAVIAEIGGMNARQIANLLTAEQPQTIAFLLGAMEFHKAAETLELLTPEIRSEVVLRMGTLEPTPTSILNKVVKNLSRHLDTKGAKTMVHFGGAGRVAAILNSMDKSLSKAILSEIEENDSVLGAQVRHKMFSFNDLITLGPAEIQRVLREVDSAALSLAMKPAPAALKEKIFDALSTRAAESLRDELEMMGSVRLKEVEAAQEGIIAIVRQLEEEGEIEIGGGDDALV
jgi:flagellar motor switch protein FliG